MILNANLGFRLRPFLRLSWTSSAAQAIWSPRLISIIKACFEVEIASVALGHRVGAIVNFKTSWQREVQERWRGHVKFCELSEGSFVVARDEGTLSSISNQHAEGSLQTLGQLLGHPPCCCAAYAYGDGGLSLADPLNAHTHQYGAAGDSVPWTHNSFWQPLGIRLVPHQPCRGTCPVSEEMSTQTQQLFSIIKQQETIDLLRQVLSWPLEWSSLHGIAETKTPILRFSNNTDALGMKIVRQVQGFSYPVHGARGVRFPYSMADRTKIQVSSGFTRGLAHNRASLITIR